MAWTPQSTQTVNKKVNPDEYVDLALKNVMDFNISVAKNPDAQQLSNYKDNYVRLVNIAEGACEGAGYIKQPKEKVDMENLSDTEKAFLDAARNLFKERYTDVRTSAASSEQRARHLLAEAIVGKYQADLELKKNELELLVENKKMSLEDASLELADFRFKSLLSSISLKKAQRMEMNI